MSDLREWSVLANDNDAAVPDGWPEGQDKSTVNNCAREMMAAMKAWYEDAGWITPNTAAQTVSRDTVHQVRIDDVDLRSRFPAGRRVRVSGGGTRLGIVQSSAMDSGDTVVTINIDPNLGYDELAPGQWLTFADADPDTITAESGSPFVSLVDGDRVRVLDTESNDDTYELDSAGGGEIVLEASEAVTDESEVDARIFQAYGIVPSGTDAIEIHVADDLGTAALRDLGLSSGQVVVHEDFGDHAFEKDGEGDCDTVDEMHAEDIIVEAAAVGSRNLLVNGDFARWQQGESFTAGTTPANDDGIYVADQWVQLSDGDDVVDITRLSSNLPGNALDGIALEWATADEEAALYQMIEQKECQSLLGGDGLASLSFQIQGGPAVGFPAKMRAAILSWNGTADQPTADPVDDGDLDWQGEGTVPDWKAGFTLEGMVEIELTSGWQECVLEGVAIDTGSAKNVGIIIWSEDDTIAAGSKVNIARVRLVAGERAIDLEAELLAPMMARTDRYFCSTFEEGTAPAHGESAGELRAVSNSGQDLVFTFQHPQRMFDVPSLALYNPAGEDGTDYIDDLQSGTSQAPDNTRITARQTIIEMTTAPTDRLYRVQAACEARFF